MITCCSRVQNAPFVALEICKAFWNLTALMSHTWCYSCSPVLVLPSGWGHFPVMDAGGSPFPTTVVLALTLCRGCDGHCWCWCLFSSYGGKLHTWTHLHGLSIGECNHSPIWNVQGTCVTLLSLLGGLAEWLLGNVSVQCGLPLTPFVWSRDFSLLSFIFVLLLEVVELGIHLAAACFLWVELLLKQFCILNCILVSVMIPWQFAVGFIPGIILYAWPCYPESKLNLVRRYLYRQFFWHCYCMFGVLFCKIYNIS